MFHSADLSDSESVLKAEDFVDKLQPAKRTCILQAELIGSYW